MDDPVSHPVTTRAGRALRFALFSLSSALAACGGSEGPAIDGASPGDGGAVDGSRARASDGAAPGADAALLDGAPASDPASPPDATTEGAAPLDAGAPLDATVAADSAAPDSSDTSADTGAVGLDASDASVDPPDANVWLDAGTADDAGWESPGGNCVVPASAWTAVPPEIVGPPESPPSATTVITVPLVATALAYDAHDGLLYAVTPASDGASGNALFTVDPSTGAVAPLGFIGSDPSAVVVSNDGRYVSAALQGAGKVQRYDTTTRALDIAYTLDAPQPEATLVTEGFFASKSSSHAVIGLVGASIGNGTDLSQEAVLYDDGVPRPFRAKGLDVPRPGFQLGQPLVSTGTDALWIVPDGFAPAMNYLCANDSGVFFLRSIPFSGGWPLPGAFGGGELTSIDGDVFDARTMTRLGGYGVSAYGSPELVMDEGLGRVVFLVGVSNAQGGTGSYALVTFDHATRALVSRVDFTPHTGQWPSAIVRFGEYGVAVLSFSNSAGEIDLVRSPLLRKHP